MLTSSLGAAAGFTLLWWVLVACWSKSLVQAEFARYIVVTGDTYLRALNRMPGKMSLPRSEVSWTLWISLLALIPGMIGMGGIIGGAAQALTILFSALDSTYLAVIIALATSGILCSGKYTQIERVMLALVSLFTLSTLASLVSMQFTPFRVSWPDLAQGFQFQFPLEYLVLALAVYGATGVNSAELSAYPYWCIEKGYASFIGAENNDPERIGRARGWIRVLQTDVWITVIILTCATVPFYLLGAGVLHATGQVPAGIDSLLVLSEIFTRNLGPGTVWLFGVTAFCILFSSCIAGFGGMARLVPDYLVEFGLLDRRQQNTRLWWTRATGMLAPLVGLISYLLQNNPIFLLSIGALAGALLLPIQSGSTLWLQGNRMRPEFRPSLSARAALWMTFLFQAALAILIIWFVVFRTS